MTPDEATGTGTAAYSISNLPQYFTLRASISGKSGSQMVYDRYSRKVQETLALTVNSFPGQRVLNLDGDESTNYVVLAQNVKVVESGNSMTITADEAQRSHTITGADNTLKSLQIGDVLCYIDQKDRQQYTGYGFLELDEHGDVKGTVNYYQYFYIKVKTIALNGDTVAITAVPEDDMEPAEFFQAVRFTLKDPTNQTSVKPKHFEIPIDRTKEIIDPLSGNFQGKFTLKGTLIIDQFIDGYFTFDIRELDKIFLLADGIYSLSGMEVESTGSFSTAIDLPEIEIPGLGIQGLGGVALMPSIPIDAIDFDGEFKFDVTYRFRFDFKGADPLHPKISLTTEQENLSDPKFGGELDVGFRSALGFVFLEKTASAGAGSVHYICAKAELKGGE